MECHRLLPIPASQGVQRQGTHRHNYHPMRNQNQNQNWSLTILGSSWLLSFFRGLLVTSEHAHEALQRGLQRCVATQQSVDCESLTPTQDATEQGVDCESLTPTRGATQQSVDCESLTPTQGAMQQSAGVKKKGGKESGRQNCILGDPQQRGGKSEVFPNKGEQNQKWLPLGGPKEGGNATSPLHSRGSPT